MRHAPSKLLNLVFGRRKPKRSKTYNTDSEWVNDDASSMVPTWPSKLQQSIADLLPKPFMGLVDSGFDVDPTFIKGISTEFTDMLIQKNPCPTSFTWEWELPAVLVEDLRTRRIDDLPGFHKHMVLIREHDRKVDIPPEILIREHDRKVDISPEILKGPLSPRGTLRAITCDDYLREHHWEYCSLIWEIVDTFSIASLNSSSLGFSPLLRPGQLRVLDANIQITCQWERISVHVYSVRARVGGLQGFFSAIEGLCKAIRLYKSDSREILVSTISYQLKQSPDNKKRDTLYGKARTHILSMAGTLAHSPFPSQEHGCWQSLFETCFIVDSYPAWSYPDVWSYTDVWIRPFSFGKGLKTSFEIMVSLAAVEFALDIDGGIIFVGYQTILYPTAIEGNCAQFHLITSENGQINPYTLDLGGRLLNFDPSQFIYMQCFIGWCDKAQVNLGTKNLPATIRYSGGQDKERSLKLDGYSAFTQFGASAPLSAILGFLTNIKYTSHRLQFTPSGSYYKLLQDTARDLAVVYDSGTRRCWLVPKLSLLLHMSHAYTLSYVRSAVDQVPFVDAHADAPDIIEELGRYGDRLVGGSTWDGLLLRQLLLGLNVNLLSTRAATQRSGSGNLYGFELMDVVTEPRRGACMKKLKIDPPGRAWLDIVNVVDALVVCSNLGEAITPVETEDRKNMACNALPKYRDWLAATVPCLSRLAERRGGSINDGDPIKAITLSEDTMLELTGTPCESCSHAAGSTETCWTTNERVQQLTATPMKLFSVSIPRRFSKEIPCTATGAISETGALAFGR